MSTTFASIRLSGAFSLAAITLFIATALSASAQGILYYAHTDGSVRAFAMGTGVEVKMISSSEFMGANPGAAREIAFDMETRLLWYTSTDNQIYSIDVDTLADGPGITGIPGLAVGAGRHLYIDYTRRKLIVPLADGSVMLYSLSDQQPAGSIPIGFFTDGNVAHLRHFASDARNGNLWYAATDGSFREMNPATLTHTGRTISFAQQTGANPGAYRHFVVDHVRNLLLYMVTDDSMASVNLATLTAAAFTVSSTNFAGAVVGAGRIITYDLPFMKPVPSRPLNGQFTLSWPNAGPAYRYTVQYRDSLSTGSWQPLPGTLWPSSSTSLADLPLSGSRRFFRIVAEIPNP